MYLRPLLSAAMLTVLLVGCAATTEPPAPSPASSPTPVTTPPLVSLTREQVAALPTPRQGRSAVIAHRGGVPENTMAAFREALATPGVGALELDVQASKDGELFVMHDLALDRTTNGTGLLKDLTGAELKQLKTPRDSTETVPTLAEVLALVKESPEHDVFIEIKTPAAADIVEKLIKAVNDAGVAKQSVIVCFDRAKVDAVRAAAPNLRTGYVSQKVDEKVLTFEGEYLFIRQSAINLDTVPQMRALGKQIYAWTINNETDMKIMLGLNIDGLITDKPADAVAVRDEVQKP